MIMLQQRIGKLLDYIRKQIYPITECITDIHYKKTGERFTDLTTLETGDWEPFREKQLWGGHREYYWFVLEVCIPEAFAGQCVCFEILTGKEGGWDATNPQFSCYVDGVLRQGLDVNHREVILTEKAVPGQKYRIILSAFTGDRNFSLKLEALLKVLDRETEHYYYDLAVPYETACLLDREDTAYIEIIRVLNESLNLLDLRDEGSDQYRASLREAQAYLTAEFYQKRCGGENRPTIYCIGHTHIDCAWLWTLRVTKDKAVRSFSTVLELMRRYPEYIFMSSQPLLYQFVKENAPEIYEQIKMRVAEGRWEPEGAMFVEPDCNLTSGESLIRQILYGKRFFMKEFGRDSIVLWLPDVFGYSAALPQIMKKTGIRYFMTTKINWNEFNRMPYDTFMWRGIDGTEILTHFMPTRDYKEGPANANRTDFFTTYNGLLNPSQVKGSWKRYSQKYLSREALMAYGYGDGGGGPTRWMLENGRRMACAIPGCPIVRMSRVRDFFEQLEQDVSDDKYLPVWSGELYLEYHRGTYTTMARNKKYNRKSEFAYQNIEWLGLMERWLAGGSYPEELLRSGWEIILKNQFHDILPGTAIKEVYDDSKKEYEAILGRAKTELIRQKEVLTERIAGDAGDVVVFNPNGLAGHGPVELDEEQKPEMLWEDGRPVALQKTEGGWIFEAVQIPSKGYKVFSSVQPGEIVPAQPSELTAEVGRLENRYFRICFNEKGQFSDIYDKREKRELLKPGQAGNVIMSYEDRPHNYDAWDINNYYEEKSWEVDQVSSIQVVEKGPVRAGIRICRKYLNSEIVQTVYLYDRTPRIDICTQIDWKEHLILLKALFPLDIHAEEASFEIQYGNVTRPTHSNTTWDFAKFEVCAHKWMDVSEWGYGVSFLNDCKYGCSVRNGVVGLTLLKSSLYPNPDADKERHEFWYSIYPHEGGWRNGGTIPEAYCLNNPLKAGKKIRSGGILPKIWSLAETDQENIIVEASKQEEEGDCLILRLYECFNKRTRTRLRLGLPVKTVWECDMLENEEKELVSEDGVIELLFCPFEIKTIKVTVTGTVSF